MAKRLIFDCLIEPCGCNLQVWIDDGAFHVGAACPSCQELALRAVQKTFPNINVKFSQ